jgi:XTP/dITP diphosphohydrolase
MKKCAIDELLEIMAKLRAPDGCPWDREQDHRTLRFHAVEEVYELIDAIEAGDDLGMEEELGDVLLQVVFHCQLAQERGAFNFDQVCRRLVSKLIHRHPHVFGQNKLKTADAVLAQWDQLKKAEKKGTRQERPSALDGIPIHLPALLSAQELIKKARRAQLIPEPKRLPSAKSKSALASELFALAEYAQSQGWKAEDLLRSAIKKRQRELRRVERKGLMRKRDGEPQPNLPKKR